MDEESQILDEHIFEPVSLLNRKEKITIAACNSILFLTIIYSCYNELHFSLYSIFLVLIFLFCILIDCLMIGRVLMRIQGEF